MIDRNSLIDAVRYGEMSIEEGEAAAKEAGLDPLETMPAGERYDPKNRAYWSFPEALSWIQFRDFDVVREFGEAWRNDRVIFVGSDLASPDGRKFEYEYKRLGPASILDLHLFEVMPITNFASLKRAAETGDIEATGIPSTGERVEIKPWQWPDLEIFDDEKSIYLATNPVGGKIFKNVLIKADGVIATFLADDAVRPAKAIQAKRGRKPKAIKEQCFELLNQLFRENGEFDAGYAEWNCQARAEEKIKEKYDLSESTARVYVCDYMKARNSEK